MARTKKTGQMTSEAAKEIANKIMQSQFQSQMQSQGLALPPELEVGPSAVRVSTKESCVDPSGNDPNTVKVGVEDVIDVDAPIPVPTEEVMWDATMFRVFNEDFPLYIKHEDLSKIAHDGQCLSIFVIQLWILAHWQMVVILPKENLVVWFCSLHNRPDNYLKGIINIALKGLDDTPQPKSKAGDRWIVVKYFNDARPLELERLKALRIQWAKYYLKVRN
ncbi:hypothetical protein HKD37_01G000677 [Glycine soja]